MLAIDSGGGGGSGGGGSGGGGNEENLVVSQQEVVSTGNYLGHNVQLENSPRKSLQIQNRLSGGFQIVKPEAALDPVQLALNSVGEGDMGDLSEMETAQDEAMKLLASHGITMLPEEPTLPAHSLTLTEAGKLALSQSAKPSRTSISLPVKTPASPLTSMTKVVKLQSSPARQVSPAVSLATSPAVSNKPIRVIKLTPAQAEAFKKSRAAGQVMFSKEKLLAASLNGSSNVSKENTEQPLSQSDAQLQPPSKKMIKLEPHKPARADKEELQTKLQLQLKQKAEEADRLREETRQRELECEKLKAQLAALSS